jgi:hypothetical protein
MDEKAKEFITVNWFKLFISAMIFLAVAMYGYQTFIVLPNKEMEAKKAAALNQETLDICIREAELGYSRNFRSECKRRGLPDNCALPLAVGSAYEDGMRKDIDECHRRYDKK